MDTSLIQAVERSVNLFNRGCNKVNIFVEGNRYIARPGAINLNNSIVTLDRRNFLGFFSSFQDPSDEEIINMVDYLMKELEIN